MLSRLIGKYKNTKHFFTSVRETIKAGYPARKLKVIGVTGTDGKTTTTHLIYQILKKSGKKVALLSTIGAFVEDKLIDTGFHTTTPDAKVLQPLMRRVADSGTEYLILEATSHGLDQHRVLGANFIVGVLTNVTHEHLDYHKTFEAYRKAKAKLFRNIKIAVLNKDDKSFSYFKNLLSPDTKLTTYALNERAKLSATKIKLTLSGMEFSVIESGKSHKIKTQLIGKYNVSNIMAAIGAVRFLGVKWDNIIETLEEFNGVSGRMEIVKSKKPFTTIVDFAHTPNSLENLLKTLSAIKNKESKLITVFGCAGERDVLKRPIMGEISAKLSNISIFTAEDPRREDVGKIIDQMMVGAKKVKSKNLVFREIDRKKAIKLAISMAGKSDILVICGKGHERSMNMGKGEIPWSDQEVTRKLLGV